METNTIVPIAKNSGIANLRRTEPAANSGRRRQPHPKRRKAKPKARSSNEVVYRVDGQVESDAQGVRVDVSA